MSRSRSWTRRAVLQSAAAGGLATLSASYVRGEPADEDHRVKGNIKQSICRWCYGGISLEKLAAAAVKFGYKSIELLSAEEYLKIKPLGLTCSMLTPKGNSIPNGFNRTENHGWLEKAIYDAVEFAAAEGLPNVICMSGNRKGMPDDEGMTNCVAGLKRVMSHAEEKKINVCMEGLNSKVDHKDYMYDRTLWGVELAKRLGSPRFKLLYDIYHMQIMEGDVIRTIRDHKDYIAHFHTGGVPGRNEIDESQELFYPAVMRAILETGYQGYVAQEFIPKHGNDPFASLAQGFRICDV
jgi:hydroxypyruvate isomerase